MSWTAERARYASLTRSRRPDDPDLLAARRRLRFERAARDLRTVVVALTDDERRELAAIALGEAVSNDA